jgi:hypothetical protein
MRRLAALLLVLPAGAGAEPPPALVEATESAAALCAGLGGVPRILDGYEHVLDLNGDGVDDFVTDQGRLECAGAWSAFCGPSGCTVTAWLSAAGGLHDRFDFGRLIDFEIREDAPRPAIVARYAPIYCGEAAVDACTRTWVFASNSPELPPVDQAAAAEAPEPAPAASAGEARPALAGWTLRHVPGASPVALGIGPGNVATLAAFCLAGTPFLAVTFHDRPTSDAVALGFAFGQGAVRADARYEETAGGAFVVPLDGSPLAARLAGRDSEVALSVDGVSEGILSLSGSTKALRAALADCNGL